jgi:2-methylcitrate dehydratase
MVAVALLDDRVLPEQYLPERILRDDVQTLLNQVSVVPDKTYSERFPDEVGCKITITTRDGRKFVKEKRDYEGFLTRPSTWETVENKFRFLSSAYADERHQKEILNVIDRLEDVQVREFVNLLATMETFSPDQ